MSAANSYSSALYEAAIAEQSSADFLNQLELQLDRVWVLLRDSKEAKTVLCSPLTTMREKVVFVEEMATSYSLSPLLKKFLILLARKGRFPLLNAIRESFSAVRLAREGGVV